MSRADEPYLALAVAAALLAVGVSYLIAALKGEDGGLVMSWTRFAFRVEGRGLHLYVLMTGIACSVAGLAFVWRAVTLLSAR
jgi:hypothetical protein